ncbi:MAG: superfamily protein [Acidimicrobiales bacterium]|jgi:undecaprenyl-diphosphatase|nr:superfamily protein [Acidimicrobiales bacterium]
MHREAFRAPLRWIRRPLDAAVVAIGVAVLGLGMLAVRDGSVSGTEESVFHAINDLPQALYPLLWPFQQLGNVVVGPIVAAVAAALRHFRLAVAVLVATAGKLVLERVVKAMVTRERPATSIGSDVHRRGDVSIRGESFVSGHAVLVAALAMLVSPYLHGRWKAVLWSCVGLVMVARVYVGAHNPLDVLCGAALGLAIGGVLNLLSGVPGRRSVLAEA